ncbi:hypothetical protein [Streptomyces longispororuber]|uniref:hypothetical protein n=1 Tax=Streptomyces longispororuber TaxID=68230 RepID=UPI0027E29FD4|nr:hypothetical protein [Streptomyces longispororuber]
MAVAAGIDVVLSVFRGPEMLADPVADLGDDRARAAAPAASADRVVATIPLKAHDQVPAAALAPMCTRVGEGVPERHVPLMTSRCGT